MNRHTTFGSPYLLGFDHLERLLERTARTAGDAYPPYNIERSDENNYRVTIAAAGFAVDRRRIVIEPINTRDIPGFFLNRQDEAHRICQAIGAPNLKVQMDLYHLQIVEGDVTMKLRQYLPTGRVGHLQIAGVPERHEPDLGEVNYRYLFERIDALGYTGVIGAEYRPRGATSAGLAWFQPWKEPRKEKDR